MAKFEIGKWLTIPRFTKGNFIPKFTKVVPLAEEGCRLELHGRNVKLIGRNFEMTFGPEFIAKFRKLTQDL